MQARSTDVDINGVSYRIERLPARVGSWIVWQIIGNMFGISEDAFMAVQGKLLSACARYEDGMPLAVFKLPATWAVPELEYDLLAVAKLTRHALEFNVAPFFEDPEFKKDLDRLRGSSQSSVPA